MGILKHCGAEIYDCEIWILKDIEGFSKRKLIYGNCKKCFDTIVTLIETRLSDNKTFINKNIDGEGAIKTLYREKKRMLVHYPFVGNKESLGWLYGANVEIKNKNGDVTQVRQYAVDFNSHKRNCIKKINTNKV